MAAAAHTRLLMAPSHLRIFLASPCLGRSFWTRSDCCLSGSSVVGRHLRWRHAVSGVAPPRKSSAVEQPRRYVQCARSSMQVETAVQVDNSEDAAAGSSRVSRNVPSFQQAVQRLQVWFGGLSNSVCLVSSVHFVVWRSSRECRSEFADTGQCGHFRVGNGLANDCRAKNLILQCREDVLFP
jgi:hypothetical protein